MPQERSVDELFRELDSKHPDFVRWSEEWTRYRDVIGDGLIEKSDYLPKSLHEHKKDYDFRVAISQFMPESGLVIDRLVGALYKEAPKREYQAQKSELDPFIERATKTGKPWSEFLEDVVHTLIGYGTTRTLINIPQTSLAFLDKNGELVEPQLTRADEKELGIRPYAINYNPLSVIDWEIDEDGVLSFVTIKETRYLRALDGSHLIETKFIQYDRARVSWWIFEEKEGGSDREIRSMSAAFHGLGLVPMVCVNLRDVLPLIGHSFMRYSSRADIRAFQVESDEGYDGYIHSHPLLAVWTDSDLKQIGVGSNTYLKLSPGGASGEREDARYIEAPTSAFDATEKMASKAREQVYRHSQVDPMGVIKSGGNSIFQASGVSRAWSFGTSEARVLKKISSKMEVIERKVFDLVIRMQTQGELDPNVSFFKGSVVYPEEFDLSSTSQLIEETERIGQIVNSETLLKTLHKRIAASKVGDVPSDVLRKIEQEIEDNPIIGTVAGKPKMNPLAAPGASFGAAGIAAFQDLGEEDEEDEEDQKKGNKAEKKGSRDEKKGKEQGKKKKVKSKG